MNAANIFHTKLIFWDFIFKDNDNVLSFLFNILFIWNDFIDIFTEYMLTPMGRNKSRHVSFVKDVFYNVSFCTRCLWVSDATLLSVQLSFVSQFSTVLYLKVVSI